MDKIFLIQLTKNLYQLTLLFPKKEPLRYKMREVANEILPDLILAFKTNPQKSVNQSYLNLCQTIEKLEILDCFFEVAKEQNWVKTCDFLVIQKEYDNLKEELKKEELELKNKNPVLESQSKTALLEPRPHSSKFSERHEKILAFLKESGQAQVWQIKQILPEVSKRTLRRDFEYLVNEGIIERVGERNDTFYQIKITTL